MIGIAPNDTGVVFQRADCSDDDVINGTYVIFAKLTLVVVTV